MEVNLTPSLNCDTPLDFNIKSNLIADMFTLIGVKAFDRRKDLYDRPRTATIKKSRIVTKETSILDEEIVSKLKVTYY